MIEYVLKPLHYIIKTLISCLQHMFYGLKNARENNPKVNANGLPLDGPAPAPGR